MPTDRRQHERREGVIKLAQCDACGGTGIPAGLSMFANSENDCHACDGEGYFGPTMFDRRSGEDRRKGERREGTDLQFFDPKTRKPVFMTYSHKTGQYGSMKPDRRGANNDK